MNGLSIYPKRRVLVTGAAGFLGRHLVAALLSKGYEVLALLHDNSLPEHLRTDAVHIMQGDIADATVIHEAVLQADAVCHLAAFIPPNYDDPAYAEMCLQINGLSTLQLAQIALKKSGLRFIYFTSAQIYKYSKKPVTEDSSVFPDKRATYYLASKLVGELYVSHLMYLYQLPAIILRVSSCYGFGMPEKSVVSRFLDCAHQGHSLQVWDGGIPTYDFVHASNVVGLAVAALEAGDPGIYNVGSGQACSVLELARTVAETFPDKKLNIEVKPPNVRIPESFPALSIEKAEKTWGYQPFSLKEGLAECRRQMEKEYR